MHDVLIEAVVQTEYKNLMEKFENPLENPCSLKVGQHWISKEATMPEGFCPSAWQSVYPYVFALANGATSFFDGWMKEPNTAMVSCNDGFRPMSFYLQVIFTSL